MKRYDFTKNISIGDGFYIEYDTKKATPIAYKNDLWIRVDTENMFDDKVQPTILRTLTFADIKETASRMFFDEEYRLPKNPVQPGSSSVRVISKERAADLFTEYDQLVSPEETGLFTRKCKIDESK